MEFAVRVSPKGQVTITTEVREALGITPGMELTYHVSGARIILERPRLRDHGAAIAHRPRGAPGRSGPGTDEVLSFIRDTAA
jgi:AbrB family looped-hinge helix DNA binding protein